MEIRVPENMRNIKTVGDELPSRLTNALQRHTPVFSDDLRSGLVRIPTDGLTEEMKTKLQEFLATIDPAIEIISL